MSKDSLKKVLEGDDEAFRLIVRKHKDDAFTLAMSVVKNEAVAQDVVQVAFIKAYNRLDTFRGESKFSTWFYRIVINEAYNRQKKQKKKAQPLESVSQDSIPTEELNEIFSKIEKDNQRYFINEALMKLPANYSLALHLFYLEEFNLQEISEITGWTNVNTRVLLHRARKEMKSVLTKLLKLKKEDLY